MADKIKSVMMKIFLTLLFCLQFLEADAISMGNLNKAILTYQTNDGKKYLGSDALYKKIRKSLAIDIYTGENSIYFEWDEKKYNIKHINIYKNSFKTPIKTITSKASDLSHRWSGYVSMGLKKNSLYRFGVEFILQNGKNLRESFSVKTRFGDRKVKKRVFKIYDELNGRGYKAKYLKMHTHDGTMSKYGLQNSAMFWVDDFFEPIPSSNDADKNRISTKPKLKKLQNLVLQRVNSATPYKVINDDGLIILDIEHMPTIVSYVAREFSPYGAFVEQFYNRPKVTQNGRKIVSQAIAKKLKCIKAVKEILPHAKVGLWGSVVPWNRYNNNSKNLDYNALAKGVNRDWLVNYQQWHHKDSKLYKALVDAVDYLSPPLYPVFDLSHKFGRKKMLGFMMSKLMEIKRLNPDAVIIPTISPQYTEGWADVAGYDKKPLPKGEFSWYLNQLYRLYQNGFIDSIIIWGDNDNTTFIDYTKQDWWFELLQFTNAHNKGSKFPCYLSDESVILSR